MMKKLVRILLNSLGYDAYRLPMKKMGENQRPQQYGIPDEEYYCPKFSPWKGYGDFLRYYSIAKPYTLVSPDRCYILLTLAKQATAMKEVWLECGVYKGGTAIMLAKLINDCNSDITFHLFDTFVGMPETNPTLDIHKKGDFSDVIFQEVQERVKSVFEGVRGNVVFHPGYIPDTFQNCGIDRISFAHVDVDIFKSVLCCCEFIYPRLVSGGFLVFDDYGFPTCPGARKAVEQYFADKPEMPIVLPTGQALVIKCSKKKTEKSNSHERG